MRLESLLRQKGIRFERSVHQPAFTSQELAAAEHTSGYEVAKPVIVKGKREFAMCVLPACAHVDLSRVAKVLRERKVRLATETEMSEVFRDCELGAEPPVGSMYGMKTVLDERLHEDDFLVMQSGRHSDAVRVRREDYERVCEPLVARISLR